MMVAMRSRSWSSVAVEKFSPAFILHPSPCAMVLMASMGTSTSYCRTLYGLLAVMR